MSTSRSIAATSQHHQSHIEHLQQQNRPLKIEDLRFTHKRGRRPDGHYWEWTTVTPGHVKLSENLQVAPNVSAHGLEEETKIQCCDNMIRYEHALENLGFDSRSVDEIKFEVYWSARALCGMRQDRFIKPTEVTAHGYAMAIVEASPELRWIKFVPVEIKLFRFGRVEVHFTSERLNQVQISALERDLQNYLKALQKYRPLPMLDRDVPEEILQHRRVAIACRDRREVNDKFGALITQCLENDSGALHVERHDVHATVVRINSEPINPREPSGGLPTVARSRTSTLPGEHKPEPRRFSIKNALPWSWRGKRKADQTKREEGEPSTGASRATSRHDKPVVVRRA